MQAVSVFSLLYAYGLQLGEHLGVDRLAGAAPGQLARATLIAYGHVQSIADCCGFLRVLHTPDSISQKTHAACETIPPSRILHRCYFQSSAAPFRLRSNS
jgi:hypothetical protein